MKITTDRFEYCELTEQDISPISNIIRDMAWNGTVFKSMTGSLVPAPKKLYENKNLLDF